MRTIWICCLLGLTAFMMSACSSDRPVMGKASTSPAQELTAKIMNQQGSQVGTAVLREVKGGVQIIVDAQGLPPGLHGFHIHENGGCVAPDFQSAGAHFNPIQSHHGVDNSQGPHVGDLPNVNVPSNGKVHLEVLADKVTLAQGAPNSLLKARGTSLVIHQGPDDYVTDPSGNSGSRIACAPIQ